MPKPHDPGPATLRLDDNAVVVGASEAAAALLQVELGALIGSSFWTYVGRDDEGAVNAAKEAWTQNGRLVEVVQTGQAGGSFVAKLEFASLHSVGLADVIHIVTLTPIDTEVDEEEALDREWESATFAHDLRQPLTTISVAADAARRAQLPPPVTLLLERIRKACSRLSDLTDDFVASKERRRSGVEILQCGPVDLADMVHELVRDLSVTHGDRRIDVEITGAVRGHWDRRRLWRILQNLGENALAHSPPQTPIRVACRLAEAGAVLLIENANPGISADELAELFEPYRRAVRAAQRPSGLLRRGHMGLGLTIARKLARAHGGDVTAWSHSDTVTFTLFMPLTVPSLEAHSTRRHQRMPLDGELEVGTGNSVIIVEGRDISQKGLGFYSDEKIDPNQHVSIRALRGPLTFSIVGRVRHVAPEGERSRVGVEFLVDLTPTDLNGFRRAVRVPRS
jgi:signal transduction histidine kinase